MHKPNCSLKGHRKIGWRWIHLGEQLETTLHAAPLCPTPVITSSGSFNDELRNIGKKKKQQSKVFNMVFLWGTIKTLNFLHRSVCASNGSLFNASPAWVLSGWGSGEGVCEYPQSH